MRRGLQRYLDEFVYRFDRRRREEALSGFVLHRAMQGPSPTTVSRLNQWTGRGKHTPLERTPAEIRTGDRPPAPHRLNSDSVVPPETGDAAAPAAVLVAICRARELLNPMYTGQRIFNRTKWIKDHETGRRRRFARLESE
jgi:hypothetical protein